MERRKFEKNIKSWAIGLGFRLPSGSPLPPDYFAALGATPHRRKLWETIVELGQPRKKIERMRKEILAARLKGFVGKSCGKDDRLDLWERKEKLEGDVREKRNEVTKLENSILTRSSDLILEICKLAEVEKQCEEYKEKQLVLLLYARRQRKLINELESVMKSSRHQVTGACAQDTQNDESWLESVEHKKTVLDKLKQIMEEIKSNENHILSEKIKIEERFNSSLVELKQRMTEEALEVMVNTKECKMLNAKVEELVSKLEEMHGNDESFSDSFYSEREKCVSHAKSLALRGYQDFLQNELAKFDDKTQNEAQRIEEKFEFALKSAEAISDDVQVLKQQKQQLTNDILAQQRELLNSLANMKQEYQEETYKKTVEDSIRSIRSALEKQIPVFMQTPLDAFRKVEAPSGRVVFECESLSHCFNHYGGGFKEFFTSMLIPPKRNVTEIVAELKTRRTLTSELKEFIRRSDELVQRQNVIQNTLSSIKVDSRICDKNLKDSDGILWKISAKSQQLYPEIEFLKKILENWVQQPYRLMINETQTINGLTLKQYEEAYNKETQ